MPRRGQNLELSRSHLNACRRRWVMRQDRVLKSSGHPDSRYGKPCGQCRCFIPLYGRFKREWGACSNPDSPHDGVVRFKHDGCEHHHDAGGWVVGSTEGSPYYHWRQVSKVVYGSTTRWGRLLSLFWKIRPRVVSKSKRLVPRVPRPNYEMSELHQAKCHLRWRERINRNIADEGCTDSWYREQCGACRYYIPLSGLLAADYGGCTHPESKFDGMVRFEHDGCDRYDYAGDWIA